MDNVEITLVAAPNAPEVPNVPSETRSAMARRARFRARAAFAVLFALCTVPLVVGRGFTVDDAWILVRYARNVAAGAGHTFNPGTPATDGATPLALPWLLAPLARADASTVLDRFRVLGGGAWLLAAAILVRGSARLEPRFWPRFSGFVLLAVSLPLGAHVQSGLETGLVTALVAIAVASPRPLVCAVLVGLAASQRPELLVFASVLSLGRNLGGSRGRIAASIVLAVAPFVAVSFIRIAAFGSPTPLALVAKPSTFSLGLLYATGGALAGGFGALVAPWAARRAGWGLRIELAAPFAHLFAVAFAGGDWMPYGRLIVPVVPHVAWLAILVLRHARPPVHFARIGIFAAIAATISGFGIAAGPNVIGARRELVRRAVPALAEARAVASLDAGWVSAATNAKIVDLAGVTDPIVASLPGGHTSKRVDVAMLLDRNVDCVVLLRGKEPASYARVAELRLAASPLFDARYELVTFLPLGARGGGYDVFRLRARD